MKNQIQILALFIALSPLVVIAQLAPPQIYSGMDGMHELADGTLVPIWGYGWIADGEITLPGPLLQYSEGSDVNLAFTNPSPESHTIHLHGLDVDQANDGVPTTSFYVATGESVNYMFNATHSGTYLYHCHVTTTLHLTMGMYGMILVTRPDNALFEGGPVVSQDVPLLFSDLEIATNISAVQSYPFHDIRPDVFMVNGLADQQLDATDQTIWSTPTEDPIALRLGSMAYSIVNCHFPAELNAQLYMSDGRAISAPTDLTSLEIFPGERFTVLISPESGYDGSFTANFRHMLDGTIESVQEILVRDEQYHPSGVAENSSLIAGYPNPVSERYFVSGLDYVRVTDLNGKVQFEGAADASGIDVSDWEEGIYVLSNIYGSSQKFVVIH